MRTEDLIVDLARQSGPWTPLAPVRVRLARWLVLAIGLGIVTVAVIGARPDVLEAFQKPAFVALVMATLASGLVAAWSALVLSVPGAGQTALWRALAVVLIVAWAMAFVIQLVAEGNAWPRLAAFPNHWGCVARISGLSILSGAVLFVMLRRAVPLRPRLCAALAALASASLAATATYIMCPIDDPAHQIVSHVVPLAAMVLVGTMIGAKPASDSRRRAPRSGPPPA